MGTDQVTPPPGFTLDPAPDLSDFAQQRKFRVTSTTGGQHNPGSAHYAGLAVDVGTREKTPQEIAGLMSDAAAQGYTVRDERTQPPGQAVWTGPHIHLQKTPGAAPSGGPGLVQKQPEIQPPPGFTLDPVQEHAASSGALAAPPRPSAEQPSPPSRFAKSYFGQINPVNLVKGIAQTVAHPIDTYQADLAERQRIGQEATQDTKTGGILGSATGLVKRLESWTPFMGPALHAIGNQFESGDVAGGYGSALGLATNLAGPEIVSGLKIKAPGIVQSGAEKLYQSALKPGTGRGIRQASKEVGTGLREGLSVSPAGAARQEALANATGQEIRGIVENAPPSPTISAGPVQQRLADVRNRFLLADDVSKIDAAETEFLDRLRSGPEEAPRNMTPQEAWETKVKTQQAVTRMKKDAYNSGISNSAAIQSQQAIASALGEQLVNQFPELRAPNARYGALADIGPDLERAVNRAANRNPIGIWSTLSGVAMGLGTGDLKAGLLAGAMTEALGNPALRSRIAIAMSRASGGRLTVPAAGARVAGYLNALGQSVADTSAQPVSQGNR